jgi:hypothetical protein
VTGTRFARPGQYLGYPSELWPVSLKRCKDSVPGSSATENVSSKDRILFQYGMLVVK